MPAEKTTAIVLRVIEFSESSCIVTLMTRDFGKVTAMAKGARRLKSPFQGALDLLSISRIVFLLKKTDVLNLLTEAKLERRFQSAAVDLNRLYAGYYIVELLAAMTDEGDPHVELYDWACRHLIAIDEGGPWMQSVMQFEIGALVLLGHKPMLEQCVECGRPKTLSDLNVSFGLQVGGILCPKCRPGKRAVANLTANSWRNLLRMSQTDDHNEPWDGGSDPELRQFLNQYMSQHLGYRPRLQKYLTLNKE